MAARHARQAVVASSGRGAWTPDALGAALVVWVDATDATTITQGGSPSRVSQWRDKTPNARHLSQATGSWQPYYLASGIGGKPAIQFVNSTFTHIRNAFGIVAQPFTIAWAFRTPASADFVQSGMMVASADINDGGTNASGTAINTFSNDGGITYGLNQFAGSGAGPPGALSQNTDYLHVGQLNGAASEASLQGTNTVVNSGTRPISGLELGAWNGGGNSSDVTIGEVVVVNRMLTTVERQSFEGYLAWKWGMQASLPALHPYKNSAP
jgi:hypothetical protein